jgi:hypothetical protein
MSDFALGWLSGCVAITFLRLAYDLLVDWKGWRREPAAGEKS